MNLCPLDTVQADCAVMYVMSKHASCYVFTNVMDVDVALQAP